MSVLFDKDLFQKYKVDPRLLSRVLAFWNVFTEDQRKFLSSLSSWTESELGELFEFVAVFYEGASNGKWDVLAKVIQKVGSSPTLGFGREIIPLLGDMRDFAVVKIGAKDPGFLNSLTDFEIQNLKFSSDSYLHSILSNRILIFIEKEGGKNVLLEDLMYIYYRRSPVYTVGLWGHQFVPVIKQNQELLGTKQINIAGLQVAQTVEHWIQDYVGFTQKPDGQREPLDRLNFLNKAPNVKLLTTEERQLLLKVLEVFDWFCDPYVTKEVVEYFEGPQDESASVNVAESDEQLEEDEPSASSTFKEQPGVEQAPAPQNSPLTANLEEETKKGESGLKQEQPPSGLPLMPVKKTSLSTTSKSEVVKNKPAKFAMPDLHEKELPEPPSDMFLEPAHDAQGSQVSANNLPSTSAQIKKEKVAETKQVLQEKDLNSDDQKPVLPPGVKMPSLAKPLERKTKLPPLKLPKTLGDLSTLKQSAQNKKQQVQSDIDQRLNNLNEELDN